MLSRCGLSSSPSRDTWESIPSWSITPDVPRRPHLLAVFLPHLLNVFLPHLLAPSVGLLIAHIMPCPVRDVDCSHATLTWHANETLHPVSISHSFVCVDRLVRALQLALAIHNALNRNASLDSASFCARAVMGCNGTIGGGNWRLADTTPRATDGERSAFGCMTADFDTL